MIRPATADDLPLMEACAREFYAASRFLRGFDLERFTASWRRLLADDAGVIFILLEAEEIAGALGGVAYPDVHNSELIATEFFWFVRPRSRGQGMCLYRAFEGWARQRGCRQIRMVHLVDSMPERLRRVYGRLGYTPAEVHYVKELK